VTFLANLGVAMQTRFERTGHLADLDYAIELKEQAVAATPGHHPDLTTRLSNLGLALQARYQFTGDLTALDRAIETGRQAVAATPVDHPDRAMRLSNLGSAYFDRFERVEGTGDLDRTIELMERAVAAAPDDHPNLATFLANLGPAYMARGTRTSSVSDVDRAISTTQQALDHTPADHPGRVRRTVNLGESYRQRFAQTGAVADLDRGIDLTRSALAAAPDDHPDRASYLANLTVAYHDRFRHTRSMSDMDSAIDAANRAVAATPDNHPDRAARLYYLAVCHQNRFDAGWGGLDRGRLDVLVHDVTAATAAQPKHRLLAGWAVGRLAYALGAYDTARRLLDAAVQLLPSVASRETLHADQEHQLGGHVGLVGETIAAHCALGDPVGALRTAEQGRGILLGAQLDSRTDLAVLDAVHPELARRLRQVRDRLNALDLGSDIVDRRRQLWTEHDALLAHVRRLPGLDRFLLSPPWHELRQAASGGTVVLVNAGRQHGDAIVVTGDAAPVPVSLPRLTAKEVASRANELSAAINDPSPFAGELRRQRVVSDVLDWLWQTSVEPVLKVVPGTMPRVWWLPIGRLGLLPLHAAGPPGGPGALDHAISSYTPTLRALAHARGRATASSRRHLTVALEHTPGLPDLPATVAEATSLHAGHPDSPLLTDEQATVGRVLAALPDASWTHFACHASTNPDSPSGGGLHLHDDALPIAEISRLELHEAELAYLSACSTGQVGWRHADESIHLAAAFQLAAVRHVIASLWPLDDTVAATAAERFYRLLPDTPSATHAAHALHEVTRSLRDEYADRPHLWASLIHSGP
jgi:tetratricopeptide (TPR) repeat protein